ncbi:MAG TPA: [FeFe] hydrogenase H-cluster radical SAM maturase HydG, partial [Candidatus Deferrimicrobium sp.]|nr:[FeFe] hydrogenase H-cluster radical SAM maturase HydG [Candidatus Deferrimicrobium sp.]
GRKRLMIDFEGISEFIKGIELTNIKQVDMGEVDEVLDIALEAKGLSLQQVAVLLSDLAEEQESRLYNAALEIKKRIYGNRLVMFAPLYVTNECTNGCLYCGFSKDNNQLERKTLSIEETINEIRSLEAEGHKRILLVAGEHPKYSNVQKVSEYIKSIYEQTGIRRINVNMAPLEIEEFQILKKAGIGTYQLFQETYHPKVYSEMHPYGKKADYNYRLYGPTRAITAGIDDVGIGALLGLFDYRFELLALLQHANSLEKDTGVGPHTISIPRLKPAEGASFKYTRYPITDQQFKKVVSILRLAVPYTGIILSTREKPELRDELLNLGISQLSAGSSTSPGGYAQKVTHSAQFEVDDHRTLNEMLKSICSTGMLPSFCTACYRRNRTGHDFMDLAKTGEIKEFCQVNAILTFKEHLLDYGDKQLKEIAAKVLQEEISRIRDKKLRALAKQKLSLTEQGLRDQHI